MVQKQDTPPELITPEEAVKIIKPNGTLEAMIRALAVAEQYNSAAARFFCCDWELARILALVYDTGRIQGIREQRQRKKANSQ